MFNLSSPVTGAAQTGLTSPTYTLTADSKPANNATQWVVSALGGTQTGVVAHTASSPFTLTFWKPLVSRLLPLINSITGYPKGQIPNNVTKFVTRKGVTPYSGAPTTVCWIETVIKCPAGAETYDNINVRAALSAHFGCISQQSSAWGDTVQTNV